MRNTQRKKVKNNSETYKKKTEGRGYPTGIVHFATPTLRHPTVSEMARLTRQQHVWKLGDRYYKLAHKHYGNSKYWWIIAWFNKRPTESHLNLGDTIYIPSPLEDILRYFGI